MLGFANKFSQVCMKGTLNFFFENGTHFATRLVNGCTNPSGLINIDSRINDCYYAGFKDGSDLFGDLSLENLYTKIVSIEECAEGTLGYYSFHALGLINNVSSRYSFSAATQTIATGAAVGLAVSLIGLGAYKAIDTAFSVYKNRQLRNQQRELEPQQQPESQFTYKL